MRTLSFAALFALALAAAPADDHLRARRWMAEAARTTNPVRLLLLAMDIRKALDRALELDAENVQVRLDLVRFHTMAPRLVGGDIEKARLHAAEIARRDAPLGHFARGYIAYREKQYGLARKELREAVNSSGDATTRTMSLRWLGWLSQESQQYDDAFAAFEQLRASDASALYEIGRTAVFCKCRREQGTIALEEYLRVKRTSEMPSAADARQLLERLKKRSSFK